jgi:ribonucleoside-diphosphate reductase alpha chain
MGLKLDYDFNGEAYYTVSGQNSNNSVRLSDAFFDAVDADADWSLTRRMDGKPSKTLKASALWDQICYAAWRCADPGLQYDTTINAWHTCPEGGSINASNPCSEYMFLDNTACNLASINLMKFYDAESKTFDIAGFEHAIDVWTMVLEISVLMASFPSREIAELSWKYRTLGLGYANLGAMLMQAGIPYDSDEGRAICGAITSIMTGRSYALSARMAGEHGAFTGYEENREHMLRVMRNHRAAAHGAARDSGAYEQLRIAPVPIDHALFRSGRINVANAEAMLSASTAAWDQALELGMEYGYRNAQVTVIAPTGTIGLLMDCDTTGVEPDFALTKFKKLAGGGYFKIANQSLRPALRSLGYTNAQTDDILTYVMGNLSLDVPMPDERGVISASQPSFRSFLIEAGFTNEELITLENGLPSCFEIGFAFSAWSMPERVLRKAGVDAERAKADMSFNGLRALGLNSRQIDALNRVICGTGTIEGASHLKDVHLPVFDCANKCGTLGKRFIAAEGHIRMMAAAQPFISGAISKTINLPNEASVDEIGKAYRLSWELGLKANALYRDGCKLSQPLATKSDTITSDAADHAEEADLDGLPDEAKVPAADGQPQIIERVVERIVERVIERPSRRRLSDTRQSITHKFNVAGHEGYLVVGLYEDGMPGELFITMAKEGSTIGGLMDSLGTAISVALQYGVPLQSLVNKFAHQRFEPMGLTQNRDIPMAKSLVDYIFRWMGMEFIQGYREQNAPHRPGMDAGSHAPAVVGGARDQVKEDSWNDRTVTSQTPRALNQTASGELIVGDRINGTHGASDSSTCCDGDSASCKHAAAPAGSVTSSTGAKPMTNALDAQAASAMGDAPPCSVCGAITVRNGTCYRCFNCGASQGCS